MEAYVGEIRMFGGNFAPVGWALCNGQLLSISENDLLFALIGTTYGGDGQTTFAVPDLRGRLPIHMGQNPTTGTTYPLGQMGGTETVTLISQQMPVHTHAVNATTVEGTQAGPSNAIWAASNLNEYSNAGVADTAMTGNAVSAVGGNLPHDNMMPSLCVNFIISLYGVYPQQS